MIRPGQVSKMWIAVSILNSGVTSAICGNIETSSDIATMVRLPGKSSRAMAYAAMVPSTRAMNVEIRQMPIELISERTKSSFWKIVEYASLVGLAGRYLPSLRVSPPFNDSEMIQMIGTKA